MKYCIENNYSPNTIGTYIKVIKIFMNEAFDKKLTDNVVWIFISNFGYKTFASSDTQMQAIEIIAAEEKGVELLSLQPLRL